MSRLVLLAALALLGTAAPVAAQPAARARYADVRLPAADPAALRAALAAARVQVDHADLEAGPAGQVLRTVLAAREVDALRRAGVAVEVLVPDLAAAVARRSGGCPTTPYPITGSMGCYPTFGEALAILDQMRAQYPALVAPRLSLGTTHEGRDVWMVELSDNPGVDEGEAEALYTALHHAREPQGMATVLHFMWDLLARYGADPVATHLLQNRRLYFVPVLNPDGYVFNETTDPAGGGYWRKNRRDNGDGEFGVDLNRNYGHRWGWDDSGSSPDTWSDLYRGPAPFSEPETAALRNFLEGRGVRMALNYHTFGDLLLFSWSYAEVTTPDHDTFRRYAAEMTRWNGYTYGISPVVLYAVNGGSDDWMYGEQTTKPKVLSYTPEVGEGSDGFWPQPERFMPLAWENVPQNTLLAWYAGGYMQVQSTAYAEAPPGEGNGHVDPGETFHTGIVLVNGGQGDAEDVLVWLESASPHLEPAPVDPAPITLAPGQTLDLSQLPVRVADDAPLGYLHGLTARVQYGEGGPSIPLPLPAVRVGTPEAVFADAAASLANWTPAGGWGLTSGNPASPPTAFADSPIGSAPPNANATLTLTPPLDLSGVEAASLRFNTRWRIDLGLDFGQVLVSPDGVNWVPLEGRYTAPGSGEGVQPLNEPGYHGSQLTWVAEEVDLTPLAGHAAVHLRFRFRGDDIPASDGWFVDDVVVERLVDGGTTPAEPGPGGGALALAAPVPNPARGGVALAFTLDAPGEVRLAVYDALGREVAVLAEGRREAGPHTARWDAQTFAGAAAPGVYLVRLTAGARSVARRVTLAR
jgi:carboxypeptidase T